MSENVTDPCSATCALGLKIFEKLKTIRLVDGSVKPWHRHICHGCDSVICWYTSTSGVVQRLWGIFNVHNLATYTISWQWTYIVFARRVQILCSVCSMLRWSATVWWCLVPSCSSRCASCRRCFSVRSLRKGCGGVDAYLCEERTFSVGVYVCTRKTVSRLFSHYVGVLQLLECTERVGPLL